MTLRNNLALFSLLALTACGNASRDNTAIGQVKRIHHETPIVCGNYTDIDLSLGVMKNGVGSMSTEDVYLVIQNRDDEKILEESEKNGRLVDVIYDTRRFSFCQPNHRITSVKYAE